MDKIILSLESSCDETACAIIKNHQLVANVISSQIATHQKYGGVMPEIASRLHLENIGCVIDDALKEANVELSEVSAIAFTRGPGLIGALHVGLQAAKTLSLIYNIPLIPVHHLAAHIYANEFVTPLIFPCLAVVVSGGNTELVYMKNHLDFEVIGETKDDAVGESYDKVARVLGLPYPGGVYIDKAAKEGKHTYKLPTPLHDGSLNFSYSGLKTAVINLVHKEKTNGNEIRIEDMAKSFQDVAINVIIERVLKASTLYPLKQVVLAGGVSANSYLRTEIKRVFEGSEIEVVIPPLWCTTDNAAMIAKLGTYLYERKAFAPLSVGVDPSWKLEDYNKF
ncbi:MAG TPA: tRNA (adenosine(37)-N6)-threonylcarbamoyltransferase complex transferase subunit TsaD [Candidatus Onthovivens sp.]|nr:tRNA (adenosine(37)-N6)-threonylcarbamoyltransferase complex transferase subunit TsaD [Candidatus Onthovivens sp.]